MEDSKVIPYGQHFRCFPQMIGSVVNQSVFMYIMDEYAQRLKYNKTLYFQISANEIANERNMTWRSVTNSLQSLQDMKLITITNNICTVEGDRFVSLIHAFNNTKGRNNRKKFAKFLETGDYDSLIQFGYIFQESSSKELLDLKGGIEQSSDYAKKQSPMLNSRTLCQMTEPYAKKQNPMLNDRTQPYAKWQNLLLKSRTYFIEMANSIRENYARREFTDEFKEYFLDFLSENELNYMVDTIFDENGVENVNFGPEWFCFLAEGVMLNSRRGLCHLAEGVMLFSRTVNKYNNINNKKEIYKENLEEDVLSRKNQSFTRDSSSSHPDSDNILQDNKEEFIDLNFYKELSPIQSSTSSYQDLKQKSRLPFFPVAEIENIISDLTYCIDRPDKIFINQVWENLLPFYVFDFEDEIGHIEEKNQDPEGMPFYAGRIITDIIMPAFERTQEIVSEGKVQIKGTEYPVTDQMLAPGDVELIIDFKLTTKDGEAVYIISKKSFRNIYEKEIPVAVKKSLREGRAIDKRYMQEIILIGDDDERYKELTPIELVIYNFISEYFNINENGEIDEPKQKFVNRVQLGRFYLSVIEKGLTEKDFLDVLFSNAPNKQDGSLLLKNRMFDSDKIKEWNDFRGHKSIICEPDTQSLKQEPKIKQKQNKRHPD